MAGFGEPLGLAVGIPCGLPMGVLDAGGEAPDPVGPLAQDDAVTVNPGGSGTVNVLANDVPGSGSIVSIEILEPPTQIDAEVVAGTPPSIGWSVPLDASGTDSLTYRVTDSNGLQSTAIVTFTIEVVSQIFTPDVVTPDVG